MQKVFRRTVFAAFVVCSLLFAAIVGATVKLYNVSAEDYPSEVESMDISKQRALEKAVKKAKKEAGVYLRTYSRSINGQLTDDEIIAITSNSYKIVGEPKFTTEIINHSDDTQIIVWKVNVDVQVDDSEIQSWIKRDDKDKSTIITQTREANRASDENERQIEDLRAKYNRATSQAEKDSIRKQMNDADRDFLANQKLEEGNKLAYKGNITDSIKLYTEAIELNPNNAIAYYTRASSYSAIAIGSEDKTAAKKFRELAIEDLNKAIELKPDYSEAYLHRAISYFLAKDYPNAIKDYDKTIEINPNLAQGYISRSLYYRHVLKDNNRALSDLNKAIELQPSAHAYINRAGFYENSKQYGRAIDDLNKAVELEPNNPYVYHTRADFYSSPLTDLVLRDYGRAAEDYTRAIELEKQESMLSMHYHSRAGCYRELKMYDKAIADYTKTIELGENNETVQILLPAIYYCRSECYKAIGDKAKSKSDLAKAKELGWKI